MLAEDQAQTPRGGTRLRLVPVEEFDPELRELVAADDRTPLELGLLRVHAHRPSHAKAIVGLVGPGLGSVRALPGITVAAALHASRRRRNASPTEPPARDQRDPRPSRAFSTAPAC